MASKTKKVKTLKPKKVSAGARKDSIIEAAGRLFAKKGFKGTTTRAIAEEVGVSEAMIFKYFKKKDDLFKAIIDRCCNDSSGRFLIEKEMDGKSGKEALRAMALFMMKRYAEDSSFARLLLYSALERQKFSEIFLKSRGMEMLNAISGIIQGMAASGDIKKTDPMLASRAFLGMIAHYSMMQEIFGFKSMFKRPLNEVADAFVDIFLNGMSRAGRAGG
ncbi:MAG: TetR/AcrR family transcriptional regulator [Deltaproteobacteria bacterium]|nr:TetR/AcrR family transcriptional regulator [Deltaproteobacteria bacterium]